MGLRAACACAIPLPLPHFFLVFYAKGGEGKREGQTEGDFWGLTPVGMPERGKVSEKAKMLGFQGDALAV